MQYIYPENFIPLPVYFHAIGIDYEQENVFRPEGYPDDQLLFVQKGAGELYVAGKSYALKKGCAFYLKGGTPHTYTSDGTLVTTWVGYRGSGLSELNAFFGNVPFLFYEKLDLFPYLSDLKDMHTVYYERKEESTLSAMLYAFVIRFFNEKHTHALSPTEKALLFMEQHFTEQISLEQLISVSGLSRSRFCKDFKETYGCTAFEKITDLRLSFAEGLLSANPKCKVKDAAHRCGFDDESYFCRVFKKKYGVSPLEKLRGADV